MTDHEVIREAEQPGGDKVVGGAAGAGAGPGHVPGLSAFHGHAWPAVTEATDWAMGPSAPPSSPHL